MYVVTGKYVIVKTMTQEGPQYRGLHEGSILPADVDEAHVKHLLTMGLVREQVVQAPVPAVRRKGSE